jgi:hypothetical protein
MLRNVSWLDGARALGVVEALSPQVVSLHHDRRYSPRLAVTLEAERFVGTQRLRERVSDISAGGLLLQGCGALPLGTRLELFLHSMNAGPGITVRAEVVRACARGTNEAPLAGLRFVDLDDASRSALELLLVGLLPEPDDHRRLGRRFDLHVPAVWCGAAGAKRLAVRLMNASSDGARLDGIELPEPGARGTLRFEADGRDGVEQVALPAVAIWADDARCSVGVAFDLDSKTWATATRAIASLLIEPREPESSLGVEREHRVAGCLVGDVLHRSERCTVFRAQPEETAQGGERVLKRIEGPQHVVDAATRRALRAMAVSSDGGPGVVNCLGTQTDSDACWLALERVEGRTLETLLAAFSLANQPVPVRGLVSIVGQVLDTLAHCANVLGDDFHHPSLDASCIWVCDDGSVKVGGFDAPLSTNGPQDDVRALAAMLYRALAGVPESDPRALSTHNAAVTPTVDVAIASALDPDPMERPADAKALLAMLDDCPVLGPQTATVEDRLLFLRAARVADRG